LIPIPVFYRFAVAFHTRGKKPSFNSVLKVDVSSGSRQPEIGDLS